LVLILLVLILLVLILLVPIPSVLTVCLRRLHK
jgi:hypothetical protein